MQFKLSENNNKWEHVKTNKERLQSLHTSDEMSIFELAYKFDVPAKKVKKHLKYFDIHIVGPIDWKEDEQVLEQVAEDNSEREFCELLSGRVTSRHVKDRIEMYDIKDYKHDYTNPDKLREALTQTNSLSAVAEEFGVHEATIRDWTQQHFDKHPNVFISEELSVDGPKKTVSSNNVGIDVDSVIERGDVTVQTEADGGSVMATVQFAVDDIITVEAESTVEIVSVEDELKERLA